MVATLCEMGEVYFLLVGTNGFQGNTENEKFTAAGLRCSRKLKFECFTSSFYSLRHTNVLKCVLHVQHDYFSSFNQSYHRSVSLPLQSWFLKLPSLRKQGGRDPLWEWYNSNEVF